MHKENTTKAEAINKAKELLHHKAEGKNKQLSTSNFLGNMFQYFKNAVSNSKPAQEYLQQRNLDFKRNEKNNIIYYVNFYYFL